MTGATINGTVSFPPFIDFEGIRARAQSALPNHTKSQYHYEVIQGDKSLKMLRIYFISFKKLRQEETKGHYLQLGIFLRACEIHKSSDVGF